MSAIVLGTGFPAARPAPHRPAPHRVRTSGATSSAAPRLRITRRGRAVLAVAVALPLAIGGVVVGLGQQAAADQHGVDTTTAARGAYTYVTVQPGDTLWSIAADVAPKADPRDVADRIVDLNQLPSAELRAGERLAVPAGLDG